MLEFLLGKVAALLLLVLSLPIFIVTMVAIKLDDGGRVFFLQDRLGKYGEIFQVFKFRTMIENADNYLDQNGMPTKDRITRVGRILRLYSIDELPQIFNILKGDMSFIGPRPALVSHWNRYTEFQKRRVEILPGITGLAQVNGRNNLPWSERIKLDIDYIDNQSFLLDLKILYKTFVVILKGKGVSMDRNASTVDDLKKHE